MFIGITSYEMMQTWDYHNIQQVISYLSATEQIKAGITYQTIYVDYCPFFVSRKNLITVNMEFDYKLATNFSVEMYFRLYLTVDQIILISHVVF